MTQQLHKRMNTEEVIAILERYLSNEIDVTIAMRLLKMKRCQFFKLLNRYRQAPKEFSIAYERKKPTRGIDQKAENLLHKELKKEQQLIENKDTPVKFYNYSYIQQRLDKQGIHISLPTIIDRAKKMLVTCQSPRKRVMIVKS